MGTNHAEMLHLNIPISPLRLKTAVRFNVIEIIRYLPRSGKIRRH